MKREPKNERVGRGRGRKEGNACRQTPRFRQRTQRPIGSASRTILTCVDQRLFHTERSCMVRDTVVYSGGQDLPSDARVFCLTSFETQSSSCDYISTSDRLIYSPKCLLDLNN